MFNRTKIKFLMVATALSSAAAFTLASCGKKEEAPQPPAAPVSRITPQELEQQREQINARAREDDEARARREAEDEKQRVIDEAEEAKRQAAQDAEDKIMKATAVKILDKENAKLKAKLAAAQQDPQSLDKHGRVYFNAEDNTGTIFTAPKAIELYDRTKPTWGVKEDDKGVNHIDPETVGDEADHSNSVGTLYRPGKAFHVDLNFGKVCAATIPDSQTVAPSDTEESDNQKNAEVSVSDNEVEAGEDCGTIKEFTTEERSLSNDIRLLQNAMRAKSASLGGPAPK